VRFHHGDIAPPQPDVMTTERKITRCRKRTVAAAENRNAHGLSF
jgi:hypothetical protein